MWSTKEIHNSLLLAKHVEIECKLFVVRKLDLLPELLVSFADERTVG